MTAIQPTIDYIRAHQQQAEQGVIELCSIPSISTLPEHQPDMERAAAWVADRMRAVGMDEVRVLPTGGHPVVYGEHLGVNDQPTILVYGHYDVQPADPIDEWESAPFDPTRRRDHLHARGASDMKGQIAAILAALEAWSRVGDKMPVNIKMMIEGEEEVGSPNLTDFIQKHGELLAADFCMNADSGIGLSENPSIVYGLRGLAYFELWVHGPQSDLHSGMFGGAVHNPAIVLCELIAGMHGADGRITLPGFYDNVQPLSNDERESFAKLPYDENSLLRNAANPPELFGEDGFSTLERIGGRPALDVNGLYSGFIGDGSKTVLPAKAMVKLSMRLVPDQDPVEIARILRAYLNEHAPKTVNWELNELAHANPVVVNRDFIGVRAAVTAIESVFGVPPTFMRMGGTVPAVSMFRDLLGIDTVNLGFALDDAGIHGPNEKMHLPTFHRGIEAYAHFFGNLSS